MGRLWKRRNLNPEAEEWGRQVQERLDEVLSRQDRLEGRSATDGKTGASGVNQALGAAAAGRETAAHVAIHHEEIEELKGRPGLPKGGWGGWVLRRKGDDGEAVWGIDLVGAEPTCEIYLNNDDPRYSWYRQIIGDGQGLAEPEDVYALTQQMMPALKVTTTSVNLQGGTGYRTSETPDDLDGDNSGSVRYAIYVTPLFDGQSFDIYFPLDQNRSTSSNWSHIDIGIYNDGGGGDYKAELHLWFLPATYAGTRVPPGEKYDELGATGDWDARKMFLEADEQLSWRIHNAGAALSQYGAGAQIIPTLMHDGDAALTYSGDKWWEANVKARELCFAFSASGGLAVVAGAHSFVNDRLERIGASLIRATVGTAPTGADIQIDVKMGGASILAAPLVIPAGQTTATAAPAQSPWPLGRAGTISAPSDSIALATWAPGNAVTVDILQVGSVEPGADLTVQVWAG